MTYADLELRFPLIYGKPVDATQLFNIIVTLL